MLWSNFHETYGFRQGLAYEKAKHIKNYNVSADVTQGAFTLAELYSIRGGLMIIGHPSSPRDPSPRRAWILNMYTEPAYRGRGLAKSIVETITTLCREQGFAWVSLHAS